MLQRSCPVCIPADGVYSRASFCPAAGVPVCPPAALQSGVGLLCHLLQQWGQVPAGAVALAQWLLGDGDAAREAAADEAPGPVRVTDTL